MTSNGTIPLVRPVRFWWTATLEDHGVNPEDVIRHDTFADLDQLAKAQDVRGGTYAANGRREAYAVLHDGKVHTSPSMIRGTSWAEPGPPRFTPRILEDRYAGDHAERHADERMGTVDTW